MSLWSQHVLMASCNLQNKVPHPFPDLNMYPFWTSTCITTIASSVPNTCLDQNCESLIFLSYSLDILCCKILRKVELQVVTYKTGKSIILIFLVTFFLQRGKSWYKPLSRIFIFLIDLVKKLSKSSNCFFIEKLKKLWCSFSGTNCFVILDICISLSVSLFVIGGPVCLLSILLPLLGLSSINKLLTYTSHVVFVL